MKILRNNLQFLIILILITYILYSNRQKEEEPEVIVTTAPTQDKSITFDIPKELDFAGEKVPLHDVEVLERLDREIHVNTYWHSSTIFTLKRAARWLPQIAEVLKEHNIPEDFKYLAIIESGLLNVVSPRGAIGFWQLMEPTGKELGLEVNEEVDERYHPIKSTEAACKYLLKAYERFGNWTNAAASYNIGMYGLDKRLQEQNVASYYQLLLNEETSRYVLRILALKEIMENPSKYGYDIPKKHLYQQEPLEVFEVDSTIDDLVAFSNKLGINYKILKQYNPWLRKNTLTIKEKGKTYEIWIPENPPSYNLSQSDSNISLQDALLPKSIRPSGKSFVAR